MKIYKSCIIAIASTLFVAQASFANCEASITDNPNSPINLGKIDDPSHFFGNDDRGFKIYQLSTKDGSATFIVNTLQSNPSAPVSLSIQANAGHFGGATLDAMLTSSPSAQPYGLNPLGASMALSGSVYSVSGGSSGKVSEQHLVIFCTGVSSQD